MEIRSLAFTDTLGTTRFEWSLSFDYSENVSHEYALPTPLVTQPYHETLKNALNVLTSGEVTYKTTIKEDYGSSMIFNYETIMTNDALYINDIDYSDAYGYVQKEDGVHELKYSNDVYSYVSNVIQDEEGNGITSLSTYYPSISIAIEWFNYDEETKTYSLSSSAAGSFGYGILSYSFLSYQIKASTSVTITLNDDLTRVTSMHFGDDVLIDATFDYSSSITLPFTVAELKPYSILSAFKGTFKTTINNEEITIVVSDDSITWNGELCSDYKENYYGELEFTYNGVSYSIGKALNKLYDNTNGGSYTLTAI